MAVDSVATLIDVLHQARLLEPAQLDELIEHLQLRYRDPDELGQVLVEKGWLTAYQLERLLTGEAAQLTLGPFTLLEPLGEGGMGQVFKARHRRLKRLAALKVIGPDLLDDPRTVRRFEQEAEAAAQLCHPNIVTIYDADEVGGRHYLAMEYVEGTDLARLVQEHGPLPVAAACDYVRQAARGLQHLHEHGLVHRDIKPSNLVVTRIRAPKPLVKILDLGVARRRPSTDSPALTHKGEVLGTPDFIAPEQATDAHAVDIRADIYSLGGTLYFLLTGRLPFPEGSLAQKLIWQQAAEPVPAEQVNPAIPLGLSAVLRKLLAKRPEDRYQTPAEVEAALLPFAEPCPPAGPSAPAAPSVANGPLKSSPPFSPPPLPPTPSAADPPRRPPIGTTLLLGIVLLLIGAALFWLFQPWFGTRSTRPVEPHSEVKAPGPPASSRSGPVLLRDRWTPLFNGQDLAGWRSWLGKADDNSEPLGFDRDPKGVFRMVSEDGQRALRITGEVPGFLTTEAEYENYHLRLEFKWGVRKWPPFDSRRSAVIYHAVPFAREAGDGRLAGLVCRLGEGHTGTCTWPAEANFSVETSGRLIPAPRPDERPHVQFVLTGQPFTVPLAVAPLVARAADHELPVGQWNSLEILTVNGACVHRVNGKVNLAVRDALRWYGLKAEPVRKGKIQLESAGAELFLRNLEIRPLEQLPDGSQ